MKPSWTSSTNPLRASPSTARHSTRPLAVTGSRIYLENLLQGEDSPNTLVVDGFAHYSRSGEGLHRYVDPADGLKHIATPSSSPQMPAACLQTSNSQT